MQLVTGEISNEHRKPIILVHGGAWDIPDEECEDHENGIAEALDMGEDTLKKGGAAEDVILQVLSKMEGSGIFDAGCGAVLTRDGEVELDAGIMYGHTKHWGAVAGVKHYVNPVRIAHKIATHGKRQFCFLANKYAEEFAREVGFESVPNEALICDREKKRYEQFLVEGDSFHTSHAFLGTSREAPRGTIGCVSMDKAGRLVAATSTGGTPFRRAGRIGDSPLPGCGYFANRFGAASATGWGEAIAAVGLCREAVGYLDQDNSPVDCITKALSSMHQYVENLDGEGATGGLILLDKNGCGAWGFTTPKMARGWAIPSENQRFIKVT